MTIDATEKQGAIAVYVQSVTRLNAEQMISAMLDGGLALSVKAERYEEDARRLWRITWERCSRALCLGCNHSHHVTAAEFYSEKPELKICDLCGGKKVYSNPLPLVVSRVDYRAAVIASVEDLCGQ